MNKFVIIETGSKQYKAVPGQKIKIEKVKGEVGQNFIFDKILLRADGETIRIGAPYIEGASAEGKILKQSRDRKKIVFRFHSKNRYKKKKGHRQFFTEIEIIKI